MANIEVPVPRHDFYQTPEHVIVAVYIKGLNAEGVKDKVDITFEQNQAAITKPGQEGNEGGRDIIKLGPFFAGVKAEGCTSRILSTKIELKLLKADGQSWTSLFSSTASEAYPTPAASAPTTDPSSEPSSSTAPPAGLNNIGMADKTTPHMGGPAKINNKRKNWDQVVEAELKEKKGGAMDPNGGDDALQKMFAGIYKDADADTKRAMIKSFTESGGTTLSTDWNSIGKEKTPIRPPDGMEARKY